MTRKHTSLAKKTTRKDIKTIARLITWTHLNVLWRRDALNELIEACGSHSYKHRLHDSQGHVWKNLWFENGKSQNAIASRSLPFWKQFRRFFSPTSGLRHFPGTLMTANECHKCYNAALFYSHALHSYEFKLSNNNVYCYTVRRKKYLVKCGHVLEQLRLKKNCIQLL